MASGAWSVEIKSKAPAARLFKAALLDWHNVGPKVLSKVISGANVISGDATVGSIRQINFTSAMPFKYVKERLDLVDHDKLECKNSVIEGGFLGTKVESASSHFRFVPSSDGGCVVKFTATYKLLPGVAVGDIDETEKAEEGMIGMIKATEAYLLANPAAYA